MRSGRYKLGALVFSGVLTVWLFSLWAGLSGRLAFPAMATVVTVVVFSFISRVKYGYLREPLVFSDISFIATVLRHPALFYLGRKEGTILGAIILGLVAIIWSWNALEPRGLSVSAQFAALMLSFAMVVVAVWQPRAVSRFAPGLTACVEREPALRFVSELGLTVSLVTGFIGWRADTSVLPLKAVAPRGWDAVVVIQSESFVDLRREGADVHLPNLDRARAEALVAGRLRVSCYGAYTHRSEVEIMTGVPFAEQGFDRFDPYLRPGRLRRASMAQGMQAAGWRTRYIHPHDARFFGRHRAIPILGYDQFIAEDAFAETDRFGLYISDRAVGERIEREIVEAQRSGQPLFLTAVTMEAHDPYGPGRLTETDDPVTQYLRHIENADALLGHVWEALNRHTERSLLVFYGDHAPLLPGHEKLADDPETDFVLLSCGSKEEPTGEKTFAAMSPATVNGWVRVLLETGKPPVAPPG